MWRHEKKIVFGIPLGNINNHALKEEIIANIVLVYVLVLWLRAYGAAVAVASWTQSRAPALALSQTENTES